MMRLSTFRPAARSIATGLPTCALLREIREGLSTCYSTKLLQGALENRIPSVDFHTRPQLKAPSRQLWAH